MAEPGRFHTGRCLCGSVKAVIHADPKWVAHCHCPSCRKATSAAFATYAGFEASAVMLKGDSLTEHSSVPGVKRFFCRVCGSNIAFEGEQWPGEIHLHIGFLDEPERFSPESHVYTKTMVKWLHVDDGLARVEGFTADGADV